MVQGVNAAFDNLDVTACSGATSCSVTNYNTNDTNIGHTVAKGQTGIADTWSDFGGSGSSIINDVKFHLRHGAASGVSGSWTINFYDETGTTLYCSATTSHAVSDTYFIWDSDSSCSWTISKLNDLEVQFASGDGGGSTNAYVYYADLFIDYTEPVFGYLNVSIDEPVDGTNVSSNGTIVVNGSVTCEGATGATCGDVTATVRYNSSSIADTIISAVDGATPLYVNGTRFEGSDNITLTARESVVGDCFVPEGITWAEGYWWLACSSPDEIVKVNPDGTLTGTTYSVSAQDLSPSGITYNGSHLILIGFASDQAHSYTTGGTYVATLFSVAAIDNTPHGIAWDGTYWWVAGDQYDKVYRFTKAGVYDSFDFAPGFVPKGVVYSELNNTLFIADSTSHIIKEYFLNGTATGFSFSSGDATAEGIAYNGSHFAAIYNGDDEQVIYDYNKSLYSPNPLSVGTMNLNDVGLVEYLVNMTAYNQSFEIDLLFESSSGSVSSNNTVDRTISNITISSGGGSPPVNECEIDCSTNPVTSSNLNCGILNVTGTGRWTITAAVTVNEENRPRTCEVAIARGTGSYSRRKG